MPRRRTTRDVCVVVPMQATCREKPEPVLGPGLLPSAILASARQALDARVARRRLASARLRQDDQIGMDLAVEVEHAARMGGRGDRLVAVVL